MPCPLRGIGDGPEAGVGGERRTRFRTQADELVFTVQDQLARCDGRQCRGGVAEQVEGDAVMCWAPSS